MANLTLFTIPLAPLYAAIAQVESDNGKTSPNVYQLTRVYVSDCNRICGGTWNEVERMWQGGRYDFHDFDRFRARWIAEKMMLEYWRFYAAVAQREGIPVTTELLANIHRYGYEGAKAYYESGVESGYWRKVRQHLHPSSTH